MAKVRAMLAASKGLQPNLSWVSSTTSRQERSPATSRKAATAFWLTTGPLSAWQAAQCWMLLSLYVCLFGPCVRCLYFASRLALGTASSFYFEGAGVEKTEAAADGSSVLLCVSAVKQQQESIEGVISWMLLKKKFLCNIVSTRRTPLYPSVKDNAVYFSPISFFPSALFDTKSSASLVVFCFFLYVAFSFSFLSFYGPNFEATL